MELKMYQVELPSIHFIKCDNPLDAAIEALKNEIDKGAKNASLGMAVSVRLLETNTICEIYPTIALLEDMSLFKIAKGLKSFYKNRT